jgi:hypothetical protein
MLASERQPMAAMASVNCRDEPMLKGLVYLCNNEVQQCRAPGECRRDVLLDARRRRDAHDELHTRGSEGGVSAGEDIRVRLGQART